MPDLADFRFIKRKERPYIFERKAECAGKDRAARTFLRPRLKSPKAEDRSNA